MAKVETRLEKLVAMIDNGELRLHEVFKLSGFLFPQAFLLDNCRL